mmetsp:Transcript_27262/g.56835  ORF Transcript_27262/g.56835 Transcript_27262/m.56835 type:complete len:247 (+) Transcript_27262:470-1210(+)
MPNKVGRTKWHIRSTKHIPSRSSLMLVRGLHRITILHKAQLDIIAPNTNILDGGSLPAGLCAVVHGDAVSRLHDETDVSGIGIGACAHHESALAVVVVPEERFEVEGRVGVAGVFGAEKSEAVCGSPNIRPPSLDRPDTLLHLLHRNTLPSLSNFRRNARLSINLIRYFKMLHIQRSKKSPLMRGHRKSHMKLRSELNLLLPKTHVVEFAIPLHVTSYRIPHLYHTEPYILGIEAMLIAHGMAIVL